MLASAVSGALRNIQLMMHLPMTSKLNLHGDGGGDAASYGMCIPICTEQYKKRATSSDTSDQIECYMPTTKTPTVAALILHGLYRRPTRGSWA